MKKPSRDELGHWWRVAKRFWPWRHEFWLGLFHDTVEDGYLPAWVGRRWKALGYLTRVVDIPYERYIERMQDAPTASLWVKRSDLMDNLTRGGGPKSPRHEKRYLAAKEMIEGYLAARGKGIP